MPVSLLVASSDQPFQEAIRDGLANTPGAKIISEYHEVTPNLYIRVLQDLERNPDAALIVDLANDPEGSLKAVEKIKLAAPGIYVIASNYHADGETVIQSVRAGANDFILQPLKRVDLRDALARLERAPRRTHVTESKLGKIYTFLGTKGGVGATTLAVNFAATLARLNRQTVLVDLDFTAHDCAMQTGASPQHSLQEVGENLARLDQTLFEGLVVRDPSGFLLVGPPDHLEMRPHFSGAMFREFASFLVERYEATVLDAGRWITDEVVLAALESSSTIFLVISQQFPAIRNAQRYLGSLMRMGFTQDQVKIVINQYSKKPDANLATVEQIEQTLNQKVFFKFGASAAVVAAVNRGRPAVGAQGGEIEGSFGRFAEKAAGMQPAVAKTA